MKFQPKSLRAAMEAEKKELERVIFEEIIKGNPDCKDWESWTDLSDGIKSDIRRMIENESTRN